jgi:hypothetical protein
VSPENEPEIAALEADAGRTLGYVRSVGRRRGDVTIEAPITSIPEHYERKPLLRNPSR